MQEKFKMPRGWYLDAKSGECYHRELCFGMPEDLEAGIKALRAKCDSWGWTDAVITATEWERRN